MWNSWKLLSKICSFWVVIKRKHQHILNVAWTLLFQSCIPFCYWGDCVLTTVYLINCTPSPLLSNKTLFELLNNNKPTYNHFCTFGCLCYAFTFSNQRTKFSSHAWASVFLGYHFGYMSYKLLDLENNKVYISRNVIFHESLLPFAYFSMSNDVVDLFSDCVIPKPIHSIYEPSCSQLSMSFPYSPESISSPTPIQTCSRPRHVVTKLAYLFDYHYYLTEHISSKPFLCPISSCLSYHKLSQLYCEFVLTISSQTEPTSFS